MHFLECFCSPCSSDVSDSRKAPTLIQALATSGLRAVYCQCPPRVLSDWSTSRVEDDHSSSLILKTWKELANIAPFGENRIQLGFAIDNLYIPEKQLRQIYLELRNMKARVITSHGVAGMAFGNAPSVVQLLNSYGLLDSDILISHANFLRDGDGELLAKHDAYISSTPNTELQRGSPPIALMPKFKSHASLGVDCHSRGTSFMPAQMRLILQYSWSERSERLAANGTWSRHDEPTVAKVFNLATVGGARAIRMAGEVGQIKIGAKADLVIFNMTSPSMLAAAQENPVAAIVLHSSERDVSTVIVDGVVRKAEGNLLPVSVAENIAHGDASGLEGRQIAWTEIVDRVLESRKRINEQINEKMRGINWRAAKDAVMPFI